MASSKEVILDLRLNGGGFDEQSWPTAAALHEKPFEMYRLRNAKALFDGPIRKTMVDPDDYDLPTLTQPIKALIGPDCFSACDVFAWMLKKTRRTELIGTKTSAGAGCSTPIVLPHSKFKLYFPTCEVFISGESTRLIETHSVAPDIVVKPSRDDALQGKDRVMRVALERTCAERCEKKGTCVAKCLAESDKGLNRKTYADANETAIDLDRRWEAMSLKECREGSKTWIKSHPKLAYPHYILARCELQKAGGNLKDAQNHFKEVLALGENSPHWQKWQGYWTHNQLGALNLRLGRQGKAREHFEKAIGTAPARDRDAVLRFAQNAGYVDAR